VLVAWDAPTETGSAVYVASLAANAKPKDAIRVSPAAADADTPRLARGPTGTIVLFTAHRALPKTDAAALPEGPGQDPEHVWVVMQALGPGDQPSGPATDLTAQSGSVGAYEVAPLAAGSTDFDVIARDAIELGAGQGGRLDLVMVRNGAASPSAPIAEHVGRGDPSLFPGPSGTPSLLLYSDPSERGRSSLLGQSPVAPVAPEPTLDGARPVGALPEAEPGVLRVLALAAGGLEHVSLRVLRCAVR
jgi:hypothetical protein